MKINSTVLIESKTIRDNYMNRVEVLEKVKKLSMLPGDVNTTIELTAEYYEVDVNTIKKTISRNKPELENDGLKVISGAELSDLKSLGVVGKNAAMFTIISRRAVLRFGMLLEQSPVAQAVRDYLLDTEEKADHRNKIPTALPEAGTIAALHISIGKSLTEVAGVKAGIAMATAYTQIEKRTGEDLSEYKRLLPPAEHETGHLNATEIGKHLGLSAQKVNRLLADMGLVIQQESEKGKKQWRLTDQGKPYGEEFPYERNGHTGYQIRWTEKVVEIVKNPT